jgi:hypothetical protein
MFEEKNDDGEWETKEDVPDNDVYEELQFQNDINWEDFQIELEGFLIGHSWLVMGSVGLWTGRHSAGKVISSFVELCDVWKDCDYLNIYDENGHLYIECSHHDGTNYFELKRLTDKGEEFINNRVYEDDRETHIKAFNCNLFTALPHYAHTEYGCKKYA